MMTSRLGGGRMEVGLFLVYLFYGGIGMGWEREGFEDGRCIASKM